MKLKLKMKAVCDECHLKASQVNGYRNPRTVRCKQDLSLYQNSLNATKQGSL